MSTTQHEEYDDNDFHDTLSEVNAILQRVRDSRQIAKELGIKPFYARVMTMDSSEYTQLLNDVGDFEPQPDDKVFKPIPEEDLALLDELTLKKIDLLRKRQILFMRASKESFESWERKLSLRRNEENAKREEGDFPGSAPLRRTNFFSMKKSPLLEKMMQLKKLTRHLPLRR